jgi:hypothetical protein
MVHPSSLSYVKVNCTDYLGSLAAYNSETLSTPWPAEQAIFDPPRTTIDDPKFVEYWGKLTNNLD